MQASMARLLATVDIQPTRNDFSGADLSGEDIRGIRWSHARFVGANLAGANLSGARLEFVDLRGARLDGACLAGASLNQVALTSASLLDVDATGTRWLGSELAHVYAAGSVWSRAVLRNCNLSHANLAGANLERALVAHCIAEGLNLRKALLDRSRFVRCALDGVVLEEARNWFRDRELVAAALAPAAQGDPRRIMMLGAVRSSDLCYADWHDLLAAEHPDLLRLALDALGRYPESGAVRALAERWEARRVIHEEPR